MHKANGPPEKRPQLIKAADAMRLMGFGWYFATCLGLGIVGGVALDRWLDTKPWFVLGGLLLGSISGFYGMYRMLKPYYRTRRS
mgnify:CR=1 FL=1